MSITLYRIIQTEFADRAFSGEGAKMVKGRWHPIGIPMVYTAMSEASAILEILVHIQSAIWLQRQYSIVEAKVDESLIQTISQETVNEYGANPRFTRAIGRNWFEDKVSVGLKVPSAVAPSDFNVLLNPTHPNFDQVEIETPREAYFDERLKNLPKLTI